MGLCNVPGFGVTKMACGCNSNSTWIASSTECATDTTSCCTTTNPSTQPHYQCVSMCQEDNCQTVYVNRIAGVFKTRLSFNMPACGETALVSFESITDLPVGAWMWSGTVGTFEIVGFDVTAGTVSLKNLCPDEPCENAVSPGATVPSCTIFVLSMPNCALEGYGPNSPFPYLDADFVAPANGNCIQIAVTTVNGLSSGATISINGGTYRIDSVDSPTLITICNDGSGITPGTVVEHDDSNGNLIVPIVVIDSNPCSATPTLSGKMLVCDAGIVKPLEGLVDGQIPVYDADTGEVEFQTTAIPLQECTVLTVCLTLDAGFPPATEYTLTVSDSSLFTVGDLIVVGGTTVMEVTDVPDGTTIKAIPIPDPAVNVTYNPGTTVCPEDCCSVLEGELAELADDLDNVARIANYNEAADLYPYETLSPTDTAFGNDASLSLPNGSADYQMMYLVTVTFTWQIGVTGDPGEYAVVDYIARCNISNAPGHVLDIGDIVYGDTTGVCTYPVIEGTMDLHSHTYTYNFTGFANAGDTLYVVADASVNYQSGTADSVTVSVCDTRIACIGVAAPTP